MGKKRKNKDWIDDDRSKNRQTEVSKEDLSEYIHASRPGIWVVTISLLLMLVALIIWGFVGTLPVTETIVGLVTDTKDFAKKYPEEAAFMEGENGELRVYCFVDASRYNGQAIKQFEDEVVLKMPDQKTFKGKIVKHSVAPLSKEKVKHYLRDNDWVTQKCVQQDYNWALLIRPEEDLEQYKYTLAEVTLLVEKVPPIYFLFK